MYVQVNEETNEIIWCASSRNSDELVENHCTPADRKNYVIASTIIAGYRVRPIKDDNGNIIGSNFDYCSCMDFGGSIPVSVINTMLPRSTVDTVDGLVQLVIKQKTDAKWLNVLS